MRCAVIGIGYFGNFHAEKYKSLPHHELTGVVDINPEICEAAAKKHQTTAYCDYRDLIGKIDLASITTSTPSHYKIARDLLQAGIHLLIEKPITCELEETEDLIQIAKKKNLTLQVGHIERFNPIITLLQEEIKNPIFIEVDRLSQYSPRNKTTDVILDLMIHDLDLVLNFVQSPVKNILAKGLGIWSKIDIANARITFQNNCVVNITESKFSQKVERKFRIYTKEKYFSIDLKEHKAVCYLLSDIKRNHFTPKIYDIEASDPLKAEIIHFLDCIENNKTPMVDGVQGKNALDLALRIKKIIENDK
jgi:predicted dehydrogenase